MTTVDRNSRITRRVFFERSARAVAGAALMATANTADAANVRAPKALSANPEPVPGKIALEEHFVIPETLAASYGASGSPEFQHRLEDIGSIRIAEMDRGGLDVCILSLV